MMESNDAPHQAWVDPIVAEVREARSLMLEEAGGSLDALFTILRRREEEERGAGREVISLPPERAKLLEDALAKLDAEPPKESGSAPAA